MSETATGDAAAKQGSAAAAFMGKPTYDRSDFLSSYYVFCQATERLYQEVLMIRKLPVDTYQLWAAVRNQGGHQQVHQRKLWAATARLCNHPKSWTNASHYFRTTYESAGLAELEDLVDSGRFSISHHNTEQQQHMLGPDPMLDGSITAVAASQPHTGPAMPLSLMLQTGTTSFTTPSQDDTQQQSSSLISSGSGFGANVVQQQQQQRHNPYASMRLAVRCGTARGIFDIPRQRATCCCAVCVATAGPGGVDMVPTEFERHGGCGSFKKWKKSIIVEETGRNLGAWLSQHGVIIMSPSALTKKVKKRQLEETLEANRASGNYAGAARAAAAASPGMGPYASSREPGIIHAPAAAARSFQQILLQQQQAYPRFELHPFAAAASDHQAEYEQVPRYGLRRVFRTSSSASRQFQTEVHYPLAGVSANHQQCRSPPQQYSLTQHDVMYHAPDMGWDVAHQPLNPTSPERSCSGFSHHRPALPGFSMGQILGASSVAQHGLGLRPQHTLEGFALVGSRIRVCWPLDREWYCAVVQAYNPALQQHMLLYDDGDLEQLNLAEQHWELVPAAVEKSKGPVLQLHMPGSPQSTGKQQLARQDDACSPKARATAAAAAAAGVQTAVPTAADAHTPNQLQQQYNLSCTAYRQYSPTAGSTPENDDAADESDAEWLAAAARPLRVMWDSREGLMRVIAAADLLMAEQEMRRQQRHIKAQEQQQQQQQQQPPKVHGQQQRQRHSQQQQEWQAEPVPALSSRIATDADAFYTASPTTAAAEDATGAVSETAADHHSLTTAAAAAQARQYFTNNQMGPRKQHGMRPPWSNSYNTHTRELAGWGDRRGRWTSHGPQQQQQQQQHAPAVWQQQACHSTHRATVSCSDGMPMSNYPGPAGLQQQHQQQQQMDTWQGQAGRSRQQADLPTACHPGPTGPGRKGAAADGDRQELPQQQQQQQQQQEQWQQQRRMNTDVSNTDAADNMDSPVECQVQVQACQDSPGYEVLAVLPGYTIQDVRIKAWDDGRLLIKAAKQYSSTAAEACAAPGSTNVPPGGVNRSTAAADSNRSNILVGPKHFDRAGTGETAVDGLDLSSSALSGGGGGGVGMPSPVQKFVQLPGRVDSKSASALMTPEGELYVQIRCAGPVRCMEELWI